ncbi:MAG: nitroreductase family protein [Candidatus Jordarchaeaceae archaeon]
MDFFETLYTRRSMRYFKKGVKIPEWKLERILDAARWAPSGENEQYWRFIVIRDQEMKSMLADNAEESGAMVMGMDPWEIVQARQWFMPEHARVAPFEGFVKLQRYPEDADVVIIPVAAMLDVDYPAGMGFANWHIILGTGMAIQNMWLAATALGVGAAFAATATTDPRRTEKICDYLGIPRWAKPIAAFCLGEPAFKRIPSPSRFPLSGLVFEEVWGNPYKRSEFRK